MSTSEIPRKMKKQTHSHEECDKRTASESESTALHTIEHPFELLVCTAARLLAGNNYPQAVERALCLLDECRHQHREIILTKRVKADHDVATKEATRKLMNTPNIPFENGLESIIGGCNAGRQRKYFNLLIAALNKDEAYLESQGIFGENPDRYKKEGFSTVKVGILRNVYHELRASGKLGIKALGKKTKKSLPDL